MNGYSHPSRFSEILVPIRGFEHLRFLLSLVIHGVGSSSVGTWDADKYLSQGSCTNVPQRTVQQGSCDYIYRSPGDYGKNLEGEVIEGR